MLALLSPQHHCQLSPYPVVTLTWSRSVSGGSVCTGEGLLPVSAADLGWLATTAARLVWVSVSILAWKVPIPRSLGHKYYSWPSLVVSVCCRLC